MSINITKEISEDLKYLLTLDDELFSKICGQLEDVPCRMFPFEEIEASIRSAGLNDEDARRMSRILLNVFFLLFAQGDEPLALAELLSGQLNRFEVDRSQQARVKERMVQLFSIKPLFISIKATSLFNDNERVLVGSKILTDVRPIFGNGNEEKALGCFLTHNLKLVYQENDSTKEFLVSLDTEELDALEKGIKRARMKANVIMTQGQSLFGQIVSDK